MEIKRDINYGWDFRSGGIPMSNIARTGMFFTATKREAREFAKNHGWLMKDVQKGFNRFCIFWFIGQGFPDDTMNVLCYDGSTMNVKTKSAF
jgi:hypothetical protein